MNPIDVVISWVDGHDQKYQQKLNDFCAKQGIDKKVAIEPTRIYQSNEIYFCLQSLRRFAPWVRTIYIITNQQTPKAVSDLKNSTFGRKIKIIDQNDLLSSLDIKSPVFNSISVEWLIWKIKGLSNNFLYLNDDFFIIRDVEPEDFFQDNKLVLRGEWKTQSQQKFSYKLKKFIAVISGKKKPEPRTNPHRGWQEKSAELTGFRKKFYLLPHAPFPLMKNSFNQYLAKKPDLLKQNASFPFRHQKQLSSVPLIVHNDIMQKRAKFANNCQEIMVNGATHSLRKIQSRLNKAKNNKNISFVCMQSIDEAPIDTRNYMLHWLQEFIDTKAKDSL
ncbi:MAG: Stealth CR1 domain-containing protein [Legionellaceae bacterium]|nr:Stealth CR1 domain-containing protein [Legionellaceae bacterium]